MRDFQKPGRSEVFAENGMCATSHPLAAQVAVETLKRGGNAVDAAIAGALLLGLCEPQMTGLGGDCFVLLQAKEGDPIKALNGSGRAPKAATAQNLRSRNFETVPVDTAEAVTIPTAVDAFCKLSETYGKLGLDDIILPLLPYFQNGIPVAPRVAYDWKTDASRLQGKAKETYLNDGKPYRLGDRFALPQQVTVLEAIAQKGRSGFYEGEIAEDMTQSLQNLGGLHTLEDFANTHSDWTTPISGQYRGMDLIEHPPNGQGATAILLNNILSHFDVAAHHPLGAKRIHLETEASKLAYDTRNRMLADPDHMARLEHMLSAETAKNLADLIHPRRARSDLLALSEAVHKETVYITVVDKNRMTVSLIYSIFHGFGSGIASDKYGILFQNRGAGFTLQRWHPNEYGGGKRPMHTIIPAMLQENGHVTTAFGVMGGAYQPCGHSRFMSNRFDYGMSLQEAIDAPRSFFDKGKLQIEHGYPERVASALIGMGHDVQEATMPIGGAQAIEILPSGFLMGASDSRKDGCALGY